METIAAWLLMCFGAYCTYKTGFIQFRRFGAAMGACLPKKQIQGKGVSAFEAMSTSLAATIGTGNIAGVAGAILLGGPGALFWMWITALFGMASKYTEIWYGLSRGDGLGPLGYLRRAPLGSVLPVLYGSICSLTALTMGNLIQVQTVTESIQSLLSSLLHTDPPRWTVVVTGLAIAALVGFSLLGGAKRVGKTAGFLVPGMSILYILGAGAVVVLNHSRILWALREVFQTALRPEAFLVGTARGVFTHEAGLGTAGIARIGRSTDSPHKEALGGIFEVFIDTNIICSLTGLAILTSGIPLPFGNTSVNSGLVIQAFSPLFGATASAGFLACALLLFAFSSILSFALYGQLCMRLLYGRGAGALYLALFLLLCVLAPFLETGMAWRIAEYANIILALIHMAGLVPLLAGYGGKLHPRFKPVQKYPSFRN